MTEFTATDYLPDVGPLDPVVIVHRDTQDAIVYWSADGQGWTASRQEALEFSSFSAANLARKVARRMHPTMQITLERMP